MSRKIALIVLCILTVALSMTLYIHLRSPYIENEYITLLSEKNKAIVKIFNSKTDQSLAKSDIANAFRDITEKQREIALISSYREDATGVLITKNERYAFTTEFYDDLNRELEKYKGEQKDVYIPKYLESLKFHLFILNPASGKLIIVYPHKLPSRLVVAYAIESIIISTIIIIIYAFAYIFTSRRKKKNSQKNEDAKEEKQAEEEKIQPEEKTPSTVESYLYSEFNKLASGHKISSIQLFMIENENISRIFELSGILFSKSVIEPETDMSSYKGLIKELSNNSTIVKDKGANLILPLISCGALVAFANIKRNTPFSGDESDRIRKQLNVISEKITNLKN